MLLKNQIQIVGLVTLLHTASIPVLAVGYQLEKNPQQYILSKFNQEQVVFLALPHKKKAVMELVSGLIPLLHEAEVSHLGLEITSDQQDKINEYIRIGTGLPEIQIHPRMESPRYRNLLVTVHWLNPNYRPSVVAVDLPKSLYSQGISRDEWVAHRIVDVFKKNAQAKMLVLLGTFHILKTFPWQNHDPNRELSVPGYLKTIAPSIRWFSIGQITNEDPAKYGFTKQFGPIRGTVAVDCDQRFSGWKIGWLSDIEIEPPDICELVDGLVIY